MSTLRTHGITGETQGEERKGRCAPCALPTAWYYEMLYLVFNYRMTDVQTALGLSQFQRLGEFVAKRGTTSLGDMTHCWPSCS
jgi:dTDP-4-amino-4,6-dideoxygalactose transaminase